MQTRERFDVCYTFGRKLSSVRWLKQGWQVESSGNPTIQFTRSQHRKSGAFSPASSSYQTTFDDVKRLHNHVMTIEHVNSNKSAVTVNARQNSIGIIEHVYKSWKTTNHCSMLISVSFRNVPAKRVSKSRQSTNQWIFSITCTETTPRDFLVRGQSLANTSEVSMQLGKPD